jgi:hypothetical protein
MRRLLTVAARRGANRAIAWTRPPSDASSFAASAGLARRLGASDGGDRQLLSRRASTSASGPPPARGKANATAAAEARRPESEAKAEEAAEAKANATTNADANADANANANADANADATATAAAATKSARDVRRGGPIDEARSGQIVTAHGNAEAVRVTSRLQGGAKQTPYRLRRDLMSDELSRELEDFVKFLTARRLGSVDAQIREVTARKYVDHVLGVFGWMHHHGGRGRYPIEELTSMKLIFPTKERKSGAFYTLVPIRPRSRGERRFLRTFAVISLRPHLAFNPRPRCLSTPTDAFQLHPDIRLYGTTLSGARVRSPAVARERAQVQRELRAVHAARARRGGEVLPRRRRCGERRLRKAVRRRPARRAAAEDL